MQQKFSLRQFHRLVQRVLGAGRDLLLAAAVAVLCSPLYAALPTAPDPGQTMGGVQSGNGNFLGTMGGWIKVGITIFGLAIGGFGGIAIVSGALRKWKEYSMGRADIAELKEYFVMGALLTVFMIVMITLAFQWIA